MNGRAYQIWSLIHRLKIPGVTEKQSEKQPEEGGSQQPEGLVVPALDLESDPPVEDAGVTGKQPEEGGWQQPEKRKRHNSNKWESISNLESDPPVEDAGVTEKQPEKQPEEGGS
jgi:hypothetical protein